MYKWGIGYKLRPKHAYSESILSFIGGDIRRLVSNRVRFYFYNYDPSNVFKRRLKDRYSSSSIYSYSS